MNEPIVKKLGLTADLLVDAEGKKAIRQTDSGTVATFVLSSLSTDRDGERIDPKGWIVPGGTVNVIADHDYTVKQVLGKLVKTWVEGDRFMGDVQFADDVATNVLAKFVVDMLDKGYLGPGSVGFMPLAWSDPDGKSYTRESPGPYWGSMPGRLYTKQELLEFSMVAVGSNRDSMIVGMRAFGLDAPVDTSGAAIVPGHGAGSTSGPAPDEMIEVKFEDSAAWLSKFLSPSPKVGAPLSREEFDRLNKAKESLQTAMDAVEAALHLANIAGSV